MGVTMRDALENRKWLGTSLPGESWRPWRVLLIATVGEALNDDERALFKKFTGRDHEPGQMVKELWVAAGRRGGKTSAAATLAIYLAALRDYRSALRKGERGRVLFIAQTMEQARTAFDYAAETIDSVPALKKFVVNRTADTLSLANGIELVVRAASFRGLRGITAVAIVADEVCAWFSDEHVNADTKILRAVRPALLTTRGPLIAISSPQGQRGEMYKTYKRHFGPHGDPRILVAQGGSLDFNPMLPEDEIAAAYKEDPVGAREEYGGEFVSHAALVAAELVQAAVTPGVTHREPIARVHYFGFVDAATGGGKDSMTCAIAHMDNGIATVDVRLERRPPFTLEAVVDHFAALFKRYQITTVWGDSHDEHRLRRLFARHGIKYRRCDCSASDLYGFLVDEFNNNKRQFAWLDDEPLTAQLIGLELRKSPSGNKFIGHPPDAHDDLINAVAGALYCAMQWRGPREADTTGWTFSSLKTYD
jgi:hypothetical protein